MNKHFLLISTLLLGLGLQAQSFVGINVDDLSDAQVLSIFERGKDQGLTIENGQEIAINNGLSAAEAVKFKTRLVRGSPNVETIKIARNGKFDHIVMSTTGKGGSTGDMLGSVSNYVLHKSKIPVYLIK